MYRKSLHAIMMVVIYFLLKGNTEVPRNPKQKFVSVDLLAFVTYSVFTPNQRLGN